jgi:hypothetical protein
MRATILCAGLSNPYHVVLVLDGSGGMAGAPLEETTAAAELVVETLMLADHSETKVSVVEFRNRARRLVGLTNDEARIRRAIRNIEAHGSAAVDAGLQEAYNVLLRGRAVVEPPQLKPDETIVLFSRGLYATGCADAVKAAAQVKSQGVLVAAVCPDSECEAGCMNRIASSPRYFTTRRGLEELLPFIFARIPTGFRIEVEKLTVVQEMPPHTRLVEGTDEPVALRPADGTYLWRFDGVPKDGITITYRVEPQRPGWRQVALESTARFTDSLGLPKQFGFNDLHALVLEPVIVTP